MSLKKPLIILSATMPMGAETYKTLKEMYSETIERLGAELFIADSSMGISVHDNSLHEAVANMAEQIQDLVESNDRLTKALIESYTEPEDEEVPRTYMDGSEVK